MRHAEMVYSKIQNPNSKIKYVLWGLCVKYYHV
jgi:hypothetical protein